jgi:hypothetical protein
VNRVNGNIRNSIRLEQFTRVCNILNIVVIPPVTLTLTNAWTTGYFDTDGSISARFNLKPQITINIVNKFRSNLEFLVTPFNGTIYETKSKYHSYRWVIQSRSDVMHMYNYFTIYSPISWKKRRIQMIEEFYINREITNSIGGDKWSDFKSRWNA